MSDEAADPRARFLASLNHEVRTPLSGILGMTDLLLETKLDAEQREYVDATRSCAESLLELLNATLEYTALSTDRFVLDESEFTLLEVLESVGSEYESKAAAKGLRLIRDFSPELPSMAGGDAMRLRQVLSHLVANAIKFTHTGYIEISALCRPSTDLDFVLLLRVTDTGIGIPSDQLQSVFESFNQIETGLARRYSGLGLGLSLAQKITSLMNGKLAATSTVGQGSTFQIEVPLRHAADYQAAPLEGGGLHRRILVVEDNPVARTITTHVLRTRGYDVDEAGSGEEAIGFANTVLYDLILMDLQMPDMDGLEAATSIRALKPYAQVPILALTANSSDEYREQCVRHGMDGFLTKPIRSTELASAVERHLGRKRRPVAISSRAEWVAQVS